MVAKTTSFSSYSENDDNTNSRLNEHQQVADTLVRFVRDKKHLSVKSSSKDFQFINVQPTSSVSTSTNSSSDSTSNTATNDFILHSPTVPQLKAPEISGISSSLYYPTTASYYTVPPGAYSVPSQSTAYIHPTTMNRAEPWVNYNIYANYYGSTSDVYSHNPYMMSGNAGTAAPTLHYIAPNYHFFSAPTPQTVQYNTSCLYPYDSHSSSNSSSTSSTASSATENTNIAPSLLTQPFQYHSQI